MADKTGDLSLGHSISGNSDCPEEVEEELEYIGIFGTKTTYLGTSKDFWLINKRLDVSKNSVLSCVWKDTGVLGSLKSFLWCDLSYLGPVSCAFSP